MKRVAALFVLNVILFAAPQALAHAGHVSAFAQANGGLPSMISVTPEGQKTIGLASTEVDPRPLDTALTTSGRIVANGLHSFDVTAQTGGRVVDLPAVPGQHVAKGQRLARLESPELAKAQYDLLEELSQIDADLSSARSALALASASREREQRLFRQGIAAAKDAQAAESQAQQAAVAVQAASRRRELERSQVRSHLAALGYAPADVERMVRTRQATNQVDVRAPGAGVVIERRISLGQSVNPGDRAFEIVDPSTVWAVAEVYEPDLPKVRLGQAIEVAVNSAPGRTYRGAIDYLGSAVDPERRTVEVHATLPADGDRLEPGAFATIRLLTGKMAPVLAIPTSAVFDDSGLKAVWVQNGDSEFDLEHVQLGTVSGQWAEVQSGVEEGDRVVSTGAYQLTAEALKEAHGAIAQAAPGEGGGDADDDDAGKKPADETAAPASGTAGGNGPLNSPALPWLGGAAGLALLAGMTLYARGYRIVRK